MEARLSDVGPEAIGGLFWVLGADVLDDPAHCCCVARDVVDRGVEGLQLLAEPAQVGDAAADVTDLLAQDPADVLAWGAAGLA